MTDMNGMSELFKHLSDTITERLEAQLRETAEQHQVIQQGMWKTIDVLSTILTTLNPTLEWLYDHVHAADRLEAAKRMDAVHEAMRDVDALVKPMRKIMEGDREPDRG